MGPKIQLPAPIRNAGARPPVGFELSVPVLRRSLNPYVERVEKVGQLASEGLGACTFQDRSHAVG
jgi:hypothetical protein